MSVGTFTAHVAFFDVLLGVIPCAAGIGHHNSQKETGNEGAGEQAAQSFRTEEGNEPNQERNDDGEQAGDDHFFQSGLGGNGNAAAVIGAAGTFQNPGDFFELTAYFKDHFVGSAAHSLHGQCREEEGQHTAEEQTGNDFGVENVDGAETNGLSVSGEQGKSGKSGGTDGETFTDGGGGVTHGVESVGDFTDMGIQFAHFGDTAGVVGDGAVSVNGNDDTGSGKHTNSGKSDTVEVGKFVRDQDRDHDNDDGERRGHHTGGNTGDDVGGGTGFAGLSDLLNGVKVERGIVFGEFPDDEAGDKTAGNGDESAVFVSDGEGQTVGGFGEKLADDESADESQDHGNGFTEVQRFLSVGAFIGAYEEAADDGSNHAGAGDENGNNNTGNGTGEERCAQSDGGDDGTAVRFEKVGTHTGNVTDVVTDVVGDGGGVTGIVFGDTGFDFTDEVSTDVGGFGVDTAAHTAEESNGGSTESETVDNGSAGHFTHFGHSQIENNKSDAETDEAETDHAETHNSAAGEGYAESRVAAALSGVGGTDIGFGSDAHTDVTGQYGAESAENIGNGGQGTERFFAAAGYKTADQKNGDHRDDHDGDDFVLTCEESHGAFMNRAADFLHFFRTGLFSGDSVAMIRRKEQGEDTAGQSDPGNGADAEKCFHCFNPPKMIINKL